MDVSVSAKLTNAKISAQKVRLVANMIRGERVEDALATLEYTPKKAAHIVKKLLNSAIANAEENQGADIDELTVSEIYVNEGPTQKRMSPRARGRADRILKRSSHITVVVAEKA